jgi:hypothetical protein
MNSVSTPPTPSPREPEPLRPRLALAGLLFTLLALWLLWPLSATPSRHLYDPTTFSRSFLSQGDVPLNAWILAWGARSIGAGDLGDLFDANAFHPAPNTIAYSEHMLGTLPVFAPLYWITGRLTLSHNLFVISTFVLAGLAAYWAALRWLGSHLAAGLVGVIYAFAPSRIYELTHVQMLSTQYVPILCYLLWEGGAARPGRRWLAIAALALLQSLCSYYLGYQAFLVAGLFLLGASFAAGEGRVRRLLWGGSALIAAAALMVGVSLPYLSVEHENPLRSMRFDTATEIAQAYLPLRADEAGWGAWLLVPIAALYGAWVGLRSPAWRTLTITLLGTIAVLLTLAVGPDGELLGIPVGGPYRLVEAVVPGWSSMRVSWRFCFATWLPVALLVALPLAARERTPRSARWTNRLGGAFGVALLLPVSAVEIRTLPAPERVHDLAPYAWLRENRATGPLLEWPMLWAQHDAEVMYLSTQHWLPILNGYSGGRPPTYALMESLANALPEPAAARTLEALNGVRWVLVRKDTLDPAALAAWERLVPVHAQLRFESERSRLYEMRFDPARPTSIRSAEPGRTLLGTPRTELDEASLGSALTPLYPEMVDVFRMSPPLALRVRNLSSARWPSVDVAASGLVAVTFRIRRAGETELRPWGEISRIAVDLAPGEETIVRAILRSPPEPGDYEVVPCLTQIDTARVRCDGGAPIQLEVPGS